jgi:hypothetical protein
VTDGDGPAHPWSMAQSIDRSIWRMLGLVTCHDAAPARRYPSRAMGALVCGLPYLFPLLGACEDHPPPSTNSWSEVSLSFQIREGCRMWSEFHVRASGDGINSKSSRGKFKVKKKRLLLFSFSMVSSPQLPRGSPAMGHP